MSEFVNYNKRDVTLPPGCKDLIDVLRLGEASPPKRGGVTRGGMTIGRLSEVPQHIARLLKSRSAVSMLSIGFVEQPRSIALLRENTLLTGVAFVRKGAENEQGIRQLLQSHGIKVVADYLLPAEAGAEPVRGVWYLLTPVLPPASEITTDLLRNVYGFSEESKVQIQYYEIGA